VDESSWMSPSDRKGSRLTRKLAFRAASSCAIRPYYRSSEPETADVFGSICEALELRDRKNRGAELTRSCTDRYISPHQRA
jgi:hypothetical protein